jgi:hypothetical protein
MGQRHTKSGGTEEEEEKEKKEEARTGTEHDDDCLKVLLFGTHGSGKTTLFRHLDTNNGPTLFSFPRETVEDDIAGRGWYGQQFDRSCRSMFRGNLPVLKQLFAADDNRYENLMQAGTAGISEKYVCKNESEGIPRALRVIDVGGTRRDRKKWVHCFENISEAFFFVNLCGLCEYIYEDDSVLEFEESLQLAENLVRPRKFQTVPAPKFWLTGYDLFENSFDSVKLTQVLKPEKEIEENAMAWTMYIAERFCSLREGSEAFVSPKFVLSKEGMIRTPQGLRNVASRGDRALYWEQRGHLNVLKMSPHRWSSQNHHLYPGDFQNRVRVFLLCLNRQGFAKIGKDCLSIIVSNWFLMEDSLI